MLSRRRSSEQTSGMEPPARAMSPTRKRLSAALRGANVLFSVVAHLDPSAAPAPAPPTASAHLPRSPTRKPDLSGDLGSTTEPSGMRRLFGRERRRGLPPSTPDSRPVHRLVVASSPKHREQIRLHQVIDGGSGSRVAVHRSWPLSDLRKIDGLGRPVEESVHFALYFSTSPRALAWRTATSATRAVFLWSLLQTCVSRLSRAPPVINLRLLDLQTTAESVERGEDICGGERSREPQSFGTFKGSTRLASSLEELPLEHRSTEMVRPAGAVSDPSANRPGSPNAASASGLLASPGEAPAASQVRAKSDEVVKEVLEPEGGELRPDAMPDVADKARMRTQREFSKARRVKRTLSEPKATALFDDIDDDSDVDSEDEGPQKADTIAPGQRAADPDLKDLNIDERAFLAAAKRLGAKRSWDMKRMDQVSSYGSDPKARLFQNRLKMTEANTRKVVAERKLLQERKLFRLSDEEQNDLSFALEMFREERSDETLQDFGSWASSRIQSLEVENISDLVSVEKQTMTAARDGSNTTTEYQPLGHPRRNNGIEEEFSYEDLVKSMIQAQPWLEKCQTLLAPYADLAEDINKEVHLLETQRRNTSELIELLATVVDALSFEYSEKSLMDGIETFDPSFELYEFDTDDFESAVQIIASKVAILERLSPLSEMSAIREVRSLLSQRQGEASNLLLPVLTDYLDKSYRSYLALHFDNRYCPDLQTAKDFIARRDFVANAGRLAGFGTTAIEDLTKHYLQLSVQWITGTLRLSSEGSSLQASCEVSSTDSTEYGRVRHFVSRNKNLAATLLSACIIEGSRCANMFRGVFMNMNREGLPSFASLLRRQVRDNYLLKEVIFSMTDADPLIGICAQQHASHVFDAFADRLQTSVRDGTALMLDRIASLLPRNEKVRDAVLEWAAGAQKEATVASGVSVDSNVGGQALEDRPAGTAGTELATASVEPQGSNLLAILENLERVCRGVARACRRAFEVHVQDTLSSLECKRDLSTEADRSDFFSRVVASVDLCCILSSVTVVARSTESVALHDAMKSTCERLISAAMKSTEVSVQSCPERVADTVKMQNYGYIAAKLSEDGLPEFTAPLSHLATRVRKQAVARWLERQSFSSFFRILKLDTAKRFSEAQIASALGDADVSSTVAHVKEAILSTMESAAETGAAEPVERDVLYALKENMEDVINSAKRSRIASETRMTLLSFSRGLLDALKVDLVRPSRKG